MRVTLQPLESSLPLGEASDAGNALLYPKFEASQPSIKKNTRRASHGRRERGSASGEAYQAVSIITMNATRKRPKWGNFEAFLPAVQSGKTCIRRAKASPCLNEQINQAIGDCRQRL